VSTATANVPVWLLNATGALDFFNNEHPKTMTAVAAALITVGSLPAIPGFAAVAGGTFLASHAFQAAGAIALGVGNWLRATQEASAKTAAANAGALEAAPPSTSEVTVRK
jgi:N6-adenosine-specific RNA methylase IME4